MKKIQICTENGRNYFIEPGTNDFYIYSSEFFYFIKMDKKRLVPFIKQIIIRMKVIKEMLKKYN